MSDYKYSLSYFYDKTLLDLNDEQIEWIRLNSFLNDTLYYPSKRIVNRQLKLNYLTNEESVKLLEHLKNFDVLQFNEEFKKLYNLIADFFEYITENIESIISNTDYLDEYCMFIKPYIDFYTKTYIPYMNQYKTTDGRILNKGLLRSYIIRRDVSHDKKNYIHNSIFFAQRQDLRKAISILIDSEKKTTVRLTYQNIFASML